MDDRQVDDVSVFFTLSAESIPAEIKSVKCTLSLCGGFSRLLKRDVRGI